MKTFCVMAAIALGLACADAAPAEKMTGIALAQLPEVLEREVRRFYPEAKTVAKRDRMAIEYDARTYQVHHLNKKFEWMDAVPERGPRSRGLVLQARLHRGRYLSAKATGSFDEPYYREIRMVQYDKAFGHHLHVVVRVPRVTRHPVPEGVVPAIERVVRDFAKYVGQD